MSIYIPDHFSTDDRAAIARLVHDHPFATLVTPASPEPLVSRFSVSNSMLLNVIARPGNCFQAMRHLLEDNHEPRPAQRRHILKAIRLYRGLLQAGIVQQLDEPDEYGRMARLTVDLQRDFALNQPLSPFALASLELLDPESPGYALDVVSVIESTLDDPRQILMAQQHAARGEAVAEMKAQGMDYATYREEMRREFPDFAIRYKRSSALQRAIGRALVLVTLGGQRVYLTRYYTVLFGAIAALTTQRRDVT